MTTKTPREGGPVYPRLHKRPTDHPVADPRPAGIRRPAGLDNSLAGERGVDLGGPTERWDLYAVVQSTLHEVWARKYSGALETRLRYSPSDCFETFAFPEGLWQTANPALVALGERYHEHRKSLMLSLWLGLTDIRSEEHT